MALDAGKSAQDSRGISSFSRLAFRDDIILSFAAILWHPARRSAAGKHASQSGGGDPLADITVVIAKVRWVMKDGRVVVDKTRP